MQARIYKALAEKGNDFAKKRVLYADSQLLVLNKPAGLVCQLSKRAKELGKENKDIGTHFREFASWLPKPLEPRHVHRLDKPTTGALLVALTDKSARSISTQLRNKTVQKTYLALVSGTPKGSSGEISTPIRYIDGYGELHREGEEAVTRWKLLDSSPDVPVSLVELQLLTGNKHQLRIHLAQGLQTPIIGDRTYNPNPNPKLESGERLLAGIGDRLFLHSSEVSLMRYLSNGQSYRLHVCAALPYSFRRLCHLTQIPERPEVNQDLVHFSETRDPFAPELHNLQLYKQWAENENKTEDKT